MRTPVPEFLTSSAHAEPAAVPDGAAAGVDARIDAEDAAHLTHDSAATAPLLQFKISIASFNPGVMLPIMSALT